MKTSTIYALCDPVTGVIRYIGKTVVSLNIRLSQHASQARKGTHTHVYCWMRSLSQRPTIKALEVVPYEQDAEAEIRVIAEYRAQGCDLVNATDGGEGKKGCLHTPESKAKIAAWGKGRKMPPKSPETLQRMADAQRGKKHTDEHKAKIALSGMGRIPTAETREKLRAASVGRTLPEGALEKSIEARKGKPLSEDHKAKISAGVNQPEIMARIKGANTGRVKSPETIEKHAAQLRGKKHTPEAIEKMRLAAIARWAARKRNEAI